MALSFGTLEYLRWARFHPVGRYNLARSGIPALTAEEFGPLEGLEPAASNEQGPKELAAAIAARYGVVSERVLPTQGTSGANFLAMAAALSPGDEALVEEPAYEPVHRLPSVFGATLRRLVRDAADGWKLRPEAVRAALTPKTRLIAVSNLHNPTGVYTPRETLFAIAEIAREAKAILLVDEVYLDFHDGAHPWTAAQLGDHVVATSSLTKVYGLGGLRCGWLAGAPELLRRASDIYDSIGVIGSGASEHLGRLAFARLPRYLARTRKIVDENRPIVDRLIAEAGLVWTPPDAGIVAFVSLPGSRDAMAFVNSLAADHDVSVVPGRFFERADRFRLGFGGPRDVVAEGTKRIAATLLATGSRRV